jgi:uncharacterized membrane protein
MSLDTPPPATPVKEDSTVAILAYITIIGFIVAIVIHGSKKTALGSYHLRQSLGLIITSFVGGFVLAMVPVVGWVLLPFFWLAILVLAVMGIIAAAGGHQKPLPVLGGKYQEWFSGAFA